MQRKGSGKKPAKAGLQSKLFNKILNKNISLVPLAGTTGIDGGYGLYTQTGDSKPSRTKRPVTLRKASCSPPRSTMTSAWAAKSFRGGRPLRRGFGPHSLRHALPGRAADLARLCGHRRADFGGWVRFLQGHRHGGSHSGNAVHFRHAQGSGWGPPVPCVLLKSLSVIARSRPEIVFFS